MSVSFYPTNIFQKEIECECSKAYRERNEFLEGHDSCPGYSVEGQTVPELNLSNDNFKQLSQFLGFPSVAVNEKVGTISAADLLCSIFLARKETALEFTRSDEVNGNVYDCGLPADRLVRYLDDVAMVAHFALENDTTVTFA